MTKLRIKLLTINDVKEFVTATNFCPADMDLISGRYIVDAKSLMGIFSIVPSDSLELQIYSDSCEDFIKSIKQFVV